MRGTTANELETTKKETRKPIDRHVDVVDRNVTVVVEQTVIKPCSMPSRRRLGAPIVWNANSFESMNKIMPMSETQLEERLYR